jgi:hypothetical protein
MTIKDEWFGVRMFANADVACKAAIARIEQLETRLAAAEVVCEITTNALYSTDDHQDYGRMLVAKDLWLKTKQN